MDFHKYPISQSLIRKFLYKGNEIEHCPKNIYHTEWIQDIPRYISDDMRAGLFMETKFIGSGARGQVVDDLPRKRLTKLQIAQNEVAEREGKFPPNIGLKKVAQIRIEQQELIFRQLCVKYQISIVPGINTQVPIKIIWEADPSIMLDMTLDIFPTPVMGQSGFYVSVIDLKATGDIHNTFGEYCYGDPENLDKTQGWMYNYGVRNIDFNLNPHFQDIITPKMMNIIKEGEVKFLMWVWNFSKDDLENKFIQVKWDENGKRELFERIRKTIAIIEKHEAEGWPTKPEYGFCVKCPIENCVDRTVVDNC